MADLAVSLALRTIRDLLLEETKFLYGVSNQVKGLESQLREMQCLLKDADKKRHESNSVRNWIKEIRDLAYRAEDVIEMYAAEISSNKVKGFRKQMERFLCILNEGITLHQIGYEIHDIRSQIEQIYKSMQAFGIKEIIQGEGSVSVINENQQWKRQTYPMEMEDCFVGMEEDLNQLVSLIVDDKQHQVISIFGMGGIGKTTIARKVYNHFETQRCFESFAWVCITQQCQIRSVLEDVLKQLIPQQKADIMNSSNIELVQLLCEVQKAKRCLIVLDDLWQMDRWNVLKHAVLVAGLKNKILVTTRKQNIAAVGFHYELGLLNVDDGWELLKKKAFSLDKAPDFTVKEKLFQEIGKEMVHKCGCLPLGICLLGGILSDKNSLMEWESMNKNFNACLYISEGIEQDNEIGGVLDLSYDDLPSYLKPCFLYMGLYKEDESIVVRDLYKLWIAEGMISHENQRRGETLTEVAELYLREMVSRCIVQVDDVFADHRYKACKLHDIVRELCLSKGKDEDFRLKVMYYEAGKLSIINNPSFLSNKTRHLSIHFTGQEDIKLKDAITSFQDKINNPNIRSLQFLKRDGGNFDFRRNVVDFRKLKLIRVLVLENCIFEGGKLSEEIGNLICLRQLSLRYCIIDKLPSSISKLTYLYTLDLLGTWNAQIPNVLKKMLRLKHLYFPGYHKDKIGSFRLSLEGLAELESLYGFSSLVHDLKSISKMKDLRELEGTVYDNKTLFEIMDGINTNWNQLRMSMLKIDEGCDLASTEEDLVLLEKVLVCVSLYALWIKVPIRRLHHRCGNQVIFPRLIHLRLSNTEIEDDLMEMLEKIPLLEDLSLLNRSFMGEVMICHAMGFPKLKSLQLKSLPNFREWRVEQGAVPCLNDLMIVSCQCLEMIPDGLKFITSLQQLHITKMPNLEKRVSPTLHHGGGEDYHKVRHVPSIFID